MKAKLKNIWSSDLSEYSTFYIALSVIRRKLDILALSIAQLILSNVLIILQLLE